MPLRQLRSVYPINQYIYAWDYAYEQGQQGQCRAVEARLATSFQARELPVRMCLFLE
jgi:hypothetical protein